MTHRGPAEAPRDASSRLYLVVGLVAFLVRFVPLLFAGRLAAQLEYDDGVYYSAGSHLLRGSLPYRDFVFVQPPAIALLMAPFGVLARSFGDDGAMAAARMFIALVGAVNAVLISRLLSRYGAMIAAFGGLLYAVWGAAVYAERTVLLEPVLNLLLLLALLALRDARRARLFMAAAILGLAVAFKLWALVDVVVLAAFVAVRDGWRSALRWLAVVAGAFAVVSLPIVAFDPTAAVRNVLRDQVGRGSTPVPFLFRFSYFRPVVDNANLATKLLTALFSLALIAMALAAVHPLWRAWRARHLPREWSEETWWSVLLVAQVATIAVSPSTFYHYADFAAPLLCLTSAAGLRRLMIAWPGRPVRRVGRAVVGVVLVAAMIASVAVVEVVEPATATATAFADGHQCVWALRQSELVAADALQRNIEHDCPTDVDAFGVALDLSAGNGDGEAITVDSVRAIPEWQARVRAQFQAGDAAILTGRLADQPFDEATMTAFSERFRLVAQVNDTYLWAQP